MLRRLSRVISSSSEGSEDDGRHPKKQVRMPVSRNQVRQFYGKGPGSNASVNELKNNSNNPAPYLTRLRTRGTLSNSDISNPSTSGTDDSIQHNYNYKNRIRASSSHNSETSDSANDTRPNILNTINLATHNNGTSEYSSDNSSLTETRSLKRRKTSIVNLVSSSETSDSGVPSRTEIAPNKRSRLSSNSDSNSSSMFTMSSGHSNEYGEISPEPTIGNEIASNDSSRSTLPRRTLRSRNNISNRLPSQTRPRNSSTRQNRIVTSSGNNIQRSSVQSNRIPERGLRSNTTQRNTRSSASASTAIQNPLQNSDRQNNRSLEMVQIALRQNVRISSNNIPNLSDESVPSSSRGRIPNPDRLNTRRTRQITFSLPNTPRRPRANQRNNSRPLANRQSNGASRLVPERQGRTLRNRATVGRATTNPNPVTAPRRNITVTEPSTSSNQNTGLNLRISIRNRQNLMVSLNRSDGVGADSDSDSSTSSSDSSIDEVVRPGRNRTRVIYSSDNTTSSESDASSIVANRVRRSVHVISDSEHEENTGEKVVNTSEKTRQAIQSDSDGETEKCPICFGGFIEQEVGTPQSCKHCFCLVCIKKWAENNNTCPVDRRTFHSIIVRSNIHGGVIREDVVPPPNLANQSSDDELLSEEFSDIDSNASSVLFFPGTLWESDSEWGSEWDGSNGEWW